MHDINKILPYLLENKRINPLHFLTLYGSKNFDHDFDLLAVYKFEDTHIDFAIGKLDIIALGIERFQALVQNHDIIVSEPILCGDLIYGVESEWMSVKDSYLKNKPQSESIFHLTRQSFNLIEVSKHFLSVFEANNTDISAIYFWKNLSFSIAYHEFARLYKLNRYPLMLSEVTAESAALKNALNVLKGTRDVRNNLDNMGRGLSDAMKMML